jgi:hypothetical protein
MSGAIAFLAEHGLMLLGGVTALLLAGVAVAGVARRSPVVRQRVCELSVGAGMVWLVLACVPMPRVGFAVRVPEARRAVETREAVGGVEIPEELIVRPRAGVAAVHANRVQPVVAVAVRSEFDVRIWIARALLRGRWRARRGWRWGRWCCGG